MSLSFTDTTSELLVGTTGRTLLIVNAFRGSITKQVSFKFPSMKLLFVTDSTVQLDMDDDVTFMKRGRLICCGTATGRIILRDPRSYNEEHVMHAHAGGVSHLDVSGNILATCGYSPRGGNLMIDPMIKLYDIRTLRALPPIPFPAGPSYVQFHPTMSNAIVAASQDGQFQFCDIANHNSATFYQGEVSGFLNALSFSSSGNMLALGDSSGGIYLWTDEESPKVNPFSRETEFCDDPAPQRPVQITDASPLSLVGLPYYSTPLLSAWPSNLTFEIGQPPPRIPPEVMANVKMIDFVGYAKTPAGLHRNQNVALSKKLRKTDADGPKFRSEQERERWFGKTTYNPENHRSKSSTPQPQTNSAAATSGNSTTVSKPYRHIEIKYSKFGVEDFDFGFYNRTPYGGLETHIRNSYTNSLLQVLFFTSPLREVCKRHIQSACPKEWCLSCELGFLFRMLEDSRGTNCQATNFLRGFGKMTQAAALGLFEPEEPSATISYSNLMQNFNRFLLEQLSVELGQVAQPSQSESTGATDANGSSPMQQIYGLRLSNISKCQCNQEIARDAWSFVVDLAHPQSLKVKNAAGQMKSRPTFADTLLASINRSSHTKAWCAHCKKYQPTSQYRRLQRLPGILSVNACAAESDLEIWRGVEYGSTADSWVPSRIVFATDGESLRVEQLNESVDLGDLSGIREMMGANADVELWVYELMASVVEIRGEKEMPHLVAHVKVTEDSWYLFNDFLVEPIDPQQARTLEKWKIPALLQYKLINPPCEDISRTVSNSGGQADAEYLKMMSLQNRRRMKDLKINYKLLDQNELPTEPGYLCALDAEFVALSKDETEIRSDGTRSIIRPSRLSLARVSVLRGSGPKEGVPFIDEYISATEGVVDYLTEFSGIKPGDLDAATSRHPLVTLKSTYKKLRLLVDLGCVFVGHGLKKDFRIINILVPPEQVIDTVDLYFLKERQRKLSLRFLAYVVLHIDIQSETHDSVEDARTALALYKKYLEYKAQGRFEEVLREIYEEGRLLGWRPPVQIHSTGQGINKVT
ncbi:poly(A)-specific ribonuclease [Gaertneriomyces sp. JEL0708]|nr:poly(A)-specific ribonuclease [Gaertneriomyces sp. JEL0708]